MPVFVDVYMLARYVRMPIFIHIVDVLDLHIQGQRCESRTFESSYVIIPQRVAYRTNIAIANTPKVACDISIYFFYFWSGAILKVRVKVMHISIDNISQTVTDRANISISKI